MNMLRGLYDTLFLWGYYWRGYALVYSSGHLVSRGSSRCASVRVETTPCSLFNVWEVLVGKWRERLHKGANSTYKIQSEMYNLAQREINHQST